MEYIRCLIFPKSSILSSWWGPGRGWHQHTKSIWGILIKL
uniref:Uncharacterized protein n=1 Tax=Rhizophora mucronata TaxID=61149 RepID=A0A2P2NMA3_RHIMU